MKLSDHQFDFIIDVAALIAFCKEHGVKVTGGELLRTKEQQNIYLEQGLSTTNKSRHLKKLAIDLNFFINDEYIGNDKKAKEKLQFIGDYWESLNDLNSWGGNWKSFLDCPHFERRA